MSLWFDLRINLQVIGRVEIRRLEYLDLSDKAAVADAVCPYSVTLDEREIGQVEHRYGDGAWTLMRKAMELVERSAPRWPEIRACDRALGG